MKAGDQVIISKRPKSLTVQHLNDCLAVVVERSGHDEFLVQIEGMPGKIGQRRVLEVDLRPSGQLRMF